MDIAMPVNKIKMENTKLTEEQIQTLNQTLSTIGSLVVSANS